MIQKLQTLLTRIINYLESNPDTRVFKAYLEKYEDPELKTMYRHLNYLNGLLRKNLDKLCEINLNYEQVINQGYSHLKRKKRILEIPDRQLKEIIGDELRTHSAQDAINVANRISKIVQQISVNSHNPQHNIIIEEAKTLASIVLEIHRDVPTVESCIRETQGEK